MADLKNKISIWEDGPGKALRNLYDDVFGGALTTVITADPNVESELSDSAAEMADLLNSVKDILERVIVLDEDAIPDIAYSISGEGGTALQNDEYWPRHEADISEPEKLSDMEDAARLLADEIVPILLLLQANPLLEQTDLYEDLFSGGFDIFDPDTSDIGAWEPPEELPQLIQDVIDATPSYIELFDDVTLSLKADIEALADSQALGPAPIFSDINLENSLGLVSNKYTHYIGMLLDPEQSDDERDKPYLPVRLAPFKEGLKTGWKDPNYSLVDNDGDLVKTSNKESDGIEIPLGTEIKIVEIVPSETGMWVGFVSEASNLSELDWDDITDDQTRVVYTKAKHVRIKESATRLNPDPYFSERATNSSDIPANLVAPLKGAAPVNPKDNNNWIDLDVNDVRMTYYDFSAHNQKVIGKDDPENVVFNTNTIDSFPVLRYSEGYYYFIRGEAPRKSEAELINESSQSELLEDSDENLNAAKNTTSVITKEDIKQEAWKNLLNYLGKNTEGGNQNLYNELYKNYFVNASEVVNTKSVNPNNQKVLFAIRSSYVDSLPETRRIYKDDFDEDSPFSGGRNFAVSLSVKEIKTRCDYLKKEILTKIKNSMENSRFLVENADGLEYDMESQIKAIEELPNILDGFLRRQSFPASMNRSDIYEMVKEGIEAADDHILQIGIRDNGEIGANVRETISYVLFSPDPGRLKDANTKNSNLFYFDPFLSEEEIKNTDSSPRSAIALRTALPLLRTELEGKYLSRALHLFLSHDRIKTKLTKGQTDLQEKWMDLLHAYLVPPVRIHTSKRLADSEENQEELDCEEMIKKLNSLGPDSSKEERLLQEKIYNSPKCKEVYFNKFKKATSAVAAGMTPAELEEKSEKLKDSSTSGSEMAYLNLLYSQFFNILDVDAIIAMIMACMQKKLGFALTAEAICEQAIIALIDEAGPDPIMQAMLANALLSPDSPASQAYLAKFGPSPPNEPTGMAVDPNDAPQASGTTATAEADDVQLDHTFKQAPIATSMAMKKTYASPMVQLIKGIESSNNEVQLIPGIRPDAPDGIYVPPTILSGFEGSTFEVPERYSQAEIESEKSRLRSLGYSESQMRSLLVSSGYLVPDPMVYDSMLGTGEFGATISAKFSEKMRSGQFSGAVDYSAVENIRAGIQTGEQWLDYMKGVMDLGSICELVVGDLLDGLKNLLKDPASFFNGGASSWFEDFLDSLKRKFVPPTMKMKFPDSLMTDNHMGNYGELALKAIISFVAITLGQIVSLLIKNALEKCLEEGDDTASPSQVPILPNVPIPTLQRANLPKMRTPDGTPISDSDVVLWLKALIDQLNTEQLCALLQGTASTGLLKGSLEFTKLFWKQIYDSGVDTVYELRVIFQSLGQEMNLDICNISQMQRGFASDICDARFDRDARCLELMNAGLTEAECQDQIDKEVDDLKSKLADLVNLSFVGSNVFKNSFPPICGENGSFVIPPGVEDTMSRITDNMLTTVKGSVISDMSSMRFFSTPPRALVAMNDPQELENAHKMFFDAIKKPYKKRVITLIGDPYSHNRKFRHGSMLPAVESHLIYPITYNGVAHYGNFSTDTNKVKAGIQLTGELSPEQELQVQQQAEAAGNEAIFKAQDTAEDILLEVILSIENEVTLNDFIKKVIPPNPPLQFGFKYEYDSEAYHEVKAKFLELKNKVYADGFYKLTNADIEFIKPLIDSSLEFNITLGKLVEAGAAQKTLDSASSTVVMTGNTADHITGFNDILSNIVAQAWALAYETKKEQLTKDILEQQIDASFEVQTAEEYILSSEQIRESLLQYLGNQDFIVTSDHLETSTLLPMTAEVFLENSSKKNLDFFEETEISSEDINESMKFFPGKSKGPLAQFFGDVSEKIVNPVHHSDFAAEIRKEFKKDMKPLVLENLAVKEHQAFRNWDSYKNNTVASFPGNINGYTSRRLYSLRVPWTLDTPLRKIDTRLTRWYSLLQSYTGVELNPYLDHGAGNSSRQFPWNWLELMSMENFNPSDITSFTEFFESESTQDILQEVGSEVDEANRHWYNWLIVSPGFRKIVAKLYELQAQSDPSNWTDHSKRHNVAYAFSHLTLGEAIGLTSERISDLFPNIILPLADAKVYLRHSTERTYRVFKKFGVQGDSQETFASIDLGEDVQLDAANLQYTPHFLVYDMHFRDPESILNADPKTMQEYFSMENDKVSKELYYDFFSSFNKTVVDHVALQHERLKEEAKFIEHDERFNPNILKYKLPFTEIAARNTFGFDGAAKTNELLTIFTNPAAGDQVNALADQLRTVNMNRNLINQNVISPLDSNLHSQIESIKDVSRFMKAATRNLPSGLKSPPHIIPDKLTLEKEVYDINFADSLPSDVGSLLNKIYMGADSQRLLAEYQNTFVNNFDMSDYDTLPIDINPTTTPQIFSVDKYNFKAQIFGQLLTHKFFEKFHLYASKPRHESLKGLSANEANQLDRYMKTLLSTYGYSALQYAYSNQTFSKMRASRLQNRGFMKKLWKKILKSPLVSDSSVDPRCQLLFDQISATSRQDLDKAETDFFDIQSVKPKVLEFYKKSLCYDVYEQTTSDENATTLSLLQGMVMLIAKIYTLEMCLAAIISWDSFDISDIFKDKLMISIVIENIYKDYDEEFIVHHSSEILKKEKSYSEFELAEELLRASSIEQLIVLEAQKISSIVKQMFVNSHPLTTDLNLNILKNSDTDFASEFKRLVENPSTSDSDGFFRELEPTEEGAADPISPFFPEMYSTLYATGGFEYVVDVKIPNNIYTMNYGDGKHRDFYTFDVSWADLEEKSDIFGHAPSRRGMMNKNYLNSVRTNYVWSKNIFGKKNEVLSKYDNKGAPEKKTNYIAKIGIKEYNNEFSYLYNQEFREKTEKQREMLGHADAFSQHNFAEITPGNNLNAKFGNISFETYVKVEDYGPNEKRDFHTTIYSEYNSDKTPCADAEVVGEANVNDYLDALQDVLYGYRDANSNFFNCHMFDTIPLPMWSYYYNNVFLKKLSSDAFLWSLYVKYGFKPFFKKISFGVRMTYSSALLAQVETINELFEKAFFPAPGTAQDVYPDTLRESKTMLTQRPYVVYTEDYESVDSSWKQLILNELSIPIVEVEREIKCYDDAYAFTVGESDRFNLDQLGIYSQTGNLSKNSNIVNLISRSNKTEMLSLTNDHHQFFYKNLANDMLRELKNTPEFKLVFDYLFPQRRYMAMAFMTSAEGLTKYIPEPTDILSQTKDSLNLIIQGLNNSTDYQYLPNPISEILSNRMVSAEGGTRGLEPDLTKEILKIIWRTSLLILKGFVELTDPAIILAKTIIDISNAIAVAVVSAVKQGIAIAKQITQAGIDAAKNTLSQLEISLGMAVAQAGALKSTLPTVSGTKLSDLVKIEAEGEINGWELTVDSLPQEVSDNMSENQKKQWEDFKKEFAKLSSLKNDYVSTKAELDKLEIEKKKIEKDAEKAIKDAEKTMKEIFSSPYLLPGMWAAMLPSMIPYGGGIIPPPFAIGPPSTVPGMIYIALLLIDAIEEKMHDDMQKLGEDPNCEDQL